MFRFADKEDCAAILVSSCFFNGNPLVLRQWIPQFKVEKEVIDRIPVWIHWVDLDLEFWSKRVLDKLASKVGYPIRTDQLTTDKERISYARILVDVDISQEIIEEFGLIGPSGDRIKQRVEYEWLPIMCQTCKKWRHKTLMCKALMLLSLLR